MLARIVLVVSLFAMIGSAVIWYRGSLDFRPGPIAGARRAQLVSMNRIYPGGDGPPPAVRTHYEASGYDISTGQRLYRNFNCNGCHANGGGAIGPALMDDRWIYGSEPRNVYQTIIEGRPNGMPSFRGKLNDQQTWQLVAYVRSLSGLVPASVRSARSDHMQATPPNTLQPTQTPRPGGESPQPVAAEP
jgi:cytochrome c oxidase cbb3-type subunit 3